VNVAAKRMTTEEVLQAIARERARLRSAVARMSDAATTVAVTGDWTAKDVLAHLIHWAGQMAAELGSPLHQPEWVSGTTDKPSDDEWNRRAVAFYRASSLEHVQRDLDVVVDAMLERISRLPDDRMNATDVIAWAGARPLWQIIGSETFAHWPPHSADIERAAAARARVS
jgi:hypothetical protein